MAYSWLYVSQLLLASSCFFLAFLYFQLTKKRAAAPTNWPFLGMLPAVLVNLRNVHDWIADGLRENGCTFLFRGPWLLGMDLLITSDPANVNHVFNANFANYPKGDEFAEIFDILGDGIFNADGERWRGLRRRAHAVMSRPRFRSFVAECSRDKVENGLVPLLSRLAEREAVVDLQDVFLRLTFDVTCNLVLGVDPGCLSIEFPAVPFADAMDDIMEALVFRHAVPPLCWKLMKWLRMWKERKLWEAREVIDCFVSQTMAKSREEKSCRESFLASYINEQPDMIERDTEIGATGGAEEAPATCDVVEATRVSGQSTIESGVDYKFVRDTTVNLMFAGRDTTAVALAWFFWLLWKNPEAESKILRELEEHSVGDRPPSGKELSKLVYLHAALCETLRLYPPVPFEHKAPAEPDVLPSGEEAPRGRKILFSAYAMGRIEGLWGEDCLEFRPERWISARGRLRHEPAYKFLSFNCGPRTCLGKEIAFTQMKAVAAAVLCNFDVEGVGGHVVEPKLSVILQMKNGWKVRIKKKKNRACSMHAI